jgi:hypothetical protein
LLGWLVAAYDGAVQRNDGNNEGNDGNNEAKPNLVAFLPYLLVRPVIF